MTRYASSPPYTSSLKTWSRSWEVQRAPYRSPLPFAFHSREETQYPNSYSPGQVNDSMYMKTEMTSRDYTLQERISNRARTGAVDKMKAGRGAALGLTLLDWRTSLSTITGALKSLVSKADRKKLYYKKRSSELYLEGVFGWLPLIQDIYDACTTLTGGHNSSPVRNKATLIDTISVDETNLRCSVQTELGVLVGGLGRINNPNLALLSDLGLLNPAAVAWDKVPYSFVVNWFLPVGGYLNSLTDLVGWDVLDGFSTTYVRKTASGQVYVYDYDLGEYVWRARYVRQLFVERTLGFPSAYFPSFQLPDADLFKSLVSLSLLDINLRKAPIRLPRKNRSGGYDYTE